MIETKVRNRMVAKSSGVQGKAKPQGTLSREVMMLGSTVEWDVDG
jgi:hypothetical protein